MEAGAAHLDLDNCVVRRHLGLGPDSNVKIEMPPVTFLRVIVLGKECGASPARADM